MDCLAEYKRVDDQEHAAFGAVQEELSDIPASGLGPAPGSRSLPSTPDKAAAADG